MHQGPLVALTSLSESRQQARGIEAGFHKYLTKFDARQLIATVNELCAQHESMAAREMSA
jgi:DNA-binding response OmpR family regulator